MLRIDVSPIRDHAFFEQAQLERLLSDDFLQLLSLALEILDLIAGRCASLVPVCETSSANGRVT